MNQSGNNKNHYYGGPKGEHSSVYANMGGAYTKEVDRSIGNIGNVMPLIFQRSQHHETERQAAPVSLQVFGEPLNA